jgi:hypothetical protein
MKIQIELDIDEAEKQKILKMSVERFLRNAGSVGANVETGNVGPLVKEDASTLWQDADYLTPLMTKIWSALQEEIYIDMVKQAKNPK